MNWPGSLALRRYFQRYLDRKQPPLPALTLTQQRIYILPSRLGLWFAVLVVLLYLLGTNYQNNLILLLSFLLIGLLLLFLLFDKLLDVVLPAGPLATLLGGN